MKIRLLLSLFVLITCSIYAQNWSPVNATESFNFRLDNDVVVTSTIKSTSVTANSNDSTFALNTVMCDSCITIVGGPIQGCDSCYGWKNKPQFFGREMVLTNSGWCNFRDPVNQVINLLAVVNDPWLFDTTANVTATVISSAFSSVMGFPDSVKTVLLSTGDTIQFSKNYGIVQWPNGYGQNSYYRLVGIHGRNIGTLVPRMMDYFNFSVGDLFEYHGKTTSGATPQQVYYVHQYEIMNKIVSGDTVTYSVDSYRIDSNYTTTFWPPVTTMTVAFSGLQHLTMVFIDSADHFGNKFNNQLMRQSNRIYDSFSPWMTPFPEYFDSCYYRCGLFLDSNSLHAIHIGPIPNPNYNFPGNHIMYSGSITPSSDTLMPFDFNTFGMNGGKTIALTLTEGLGQTFTFYDDNFEWMWGEKLWAYRKGNDTVGTFTNKLLFDGISEQERMLAVYVFPNPSSGVINIQLPANTNADISILDLQGRVVKTFAKQSGQITLQAADLVDGIYLLDVRSSLGNAQQKIVISH